MASFISLEDHFVSEAMLAQSTGAESFALKLWPADLQEKLSSLEGLRLSDRDRGEIALQVVSPIPACESLDVCRKTNDQLAEAVERSGGRLAGFAALPMGQPDEAAAELERCIRRLGFVGTLIPNHADGRYFDGPEYRPFWAQAHTLDKPVYLHPCPASEAARPQFDGHFAPEVATMLSMGGWGWHADVALHFIKLYASGLFDAYPHLKLVLGHMGEMLPYMIIRVNGRISRLVKRERDLLQVWAENVWITVSGIWDLAPFACAIRSVAMDRILFSVDYPFERNETGRDFMLEVRKSGLVTDEQWEMIAFRNAERLLGVKRHDTA